MGKLTLAERCEQTPGPDRKLDFLIDLAVQGLPAVTDEEAAEFAALVDDLGEELKPYTASLDAAMTLVPEGCHLQHFSDTDLDNPDAQKWTAAIRARESGDLAWNDEARVWCATGPLAICAAALRARTQNTPE